jgi:hypothetical protein
MPFSIQEKGYRHIRFAGRRVTKPIFQSGATMSDPPSAVTEVARQNHLGTIDIPPWSQTLHLPRGYAGMC